MKNKLKYCIFTMLAFLIANIQSIEAAAPNPPVIDGAPVQPPVQPPAGISNPVPIDGLTWVQDFSDMRDGYQPSHGNGDNYFSKNQTHVVSGQATVSGKALQVDFHSDPCDHNPGATNGIIFGKSQTLNIEVGDEFWWRMRVRLEPGFSFNSHDCGGESGKSYVKFMRLQLNKGGSTTNRTTSHIKAGGLDMSGTTNENAWNSAHNMNSAPPGSRRSEIPCNFSDNEWHTVEYYFKMTPNTHNAGDFKIWCDGERVFTSLSVPGAPILENEGSATRMMINDWWNGGAPKDQSLWIGDVVYSIEPPYVDSRGFPFIGK